MKFAHLSDTHLGYRQYGLVDRELDFYNVFEDIIDKIIDLDVDFVVHSGDLFETSRPSTDALLKVQRAVNKLDKAGIPIYAIAGNHDMPRRANPIPPQVLFKYNGIKLISPIKSFYREEDYFIGGVPYKPQNRNLVLKDDLERLSKKAEPFENKILVLHQGIDKYVPQYELEIGDLPINFNYYAMGHLHNYINDSFGEGRLVYPGSTEIWKSNELEDYKKNGKGFVLVEMDHGEVSTERIKMDLPREFINENIDYTFLNNEILKLKSYIEKLNKPPIVNLTISGKNFAGADVYEYLNKELSDSTLLFRPNFNIIEDNQDIAPINEGINIDKLISEKMNSENEDVINLAVDLFNDLSKDNTEEAIDDLKVCYDKLFKGDD
ncbi:metallophosphoesterase [Methanobrevibacter sp. 87.7]|uniref:metallophosphoesterase family protein n=1 Tax=Methanobrevibacter sp. 87.7 TaxID=387957 RepID=UPI000B50322C|nr:DNA repair exonuclease [Methanobrevibacter sp. 87.7]OWT32833.1 metallophosphoesterase [Methanobrevibacter sp. 87.7]